ncbi:regulator [Mycobacterium sp. 1100029.7]|nr:regulator [Mycobacterium sp. 1100029.7]
MLGLHNGSVVRADTLITLLWGDAPPRTAAKALQTHISSLRRTLGERVVVTEGVGWVLAGAEVDASRYKLAAKRGRDAAAAGDHSQAVARFEEALGLWRGIPELPEGQRGLSEKTRWIESHAALVEDRADALLATGRAAEVVGDLEAAVAEAPLRERRWAQLMLALYRAGRQGEALGAYQRARSLLADELGVDPGPELRRLETAIVGQDASLDITVAQQLPSVTRAVTFVLTDIEGSTAAWEADADAMAVALARHDELVEQVVTSRGGRLIKTRGEGDATFSVFERPSAAAAAAIELQEAITHEPWALREPLRIRMALHTGEVELRDGDYFGRAVNRVARLRSLAEGGQILCSGATAELVIDSLADDVMLTDLGMRQLKNLARPEHVFELRLETTEDRPESLPAEAPMQRPDLPAVLVGPGPFVGRGDELRRLLSVWQTALAGGIRTVLIAGEPGVGKTRLAGEWSQQAHGQGAVVLYGRCDEDLGAPYQPFAEALRSLVPCMGADRLRGLRAVEALLPLVPGLTDVVPDLTPPARSDPDTERYALFDAVVALLEIASRSAPVLLILDDLHWAAKPTLLLLRHLLRFGDHARVQIVGTYRSTDLDRSHPLAAMLADLHRDGTANRLTLGGLDEDDVTTYVAEAGYDDEELAHALATVTGGNPFFLIEALRHVDESGGVWDQSTLPQGVREAVSRRLSRLPVETNKALAAAAVVGSRFALDLVEQVVGDDLVDAFDEARQAGIVIEEPGGNYRFNHAIVRQSLLAELASVRRMRLHQRIATTLETLPGADDELLAELAHHYFECAWAGNAAKAVLYCRRAADQAMTRLAYEGAADLYHQALHALEELDEEIADREDQTAELLVARCEALLAAGDVASAAGAVDQLRRATIDSPRLAAWATCFDGQLSMLIHPERLDEVEAALRAAATKLAELDDAAGEAKAHTVRANCLARLGRIADCEVALDEALTAARRAREHRRVNAVLAGAPLAALWGPNPVPRAGGRCLDVVRLLRITTDSPAVEATSTRCQAVLEAFRGRATAARRMIESARRTVTELGLRHARLEVEQFAGIVELIIDDAAAAEPYLRKAYNGFRRMGLDADTAETAALLGRACLALARDDEANELCTESERLAGHALKASIAWRTLRAHLLARCNDYDAARRVAEEAVTLAERTDALVDHGDACLTLATVLAAAGNTRGARAAAEQAVALYERKGAAALAEMARGILGVRDTPPAPSEPEPESVELDNACVRMIARTDAALHRGDWDEFHRVYGDDFFFESRRKLVGFSLTDLPSEDWQSVTKPLLESGETVLHRHEVIAVRGERLALYRAELGNTDVDSGAPRAAFLQLVGIDDDSRVALEVWFDVEDMDAAVAELDAAHARFKAERPPPARLENKAALVFEHVWSHLATRDWDAMAQTVAEDYVGIDHRRVVSAETQRSRHQVIKDLQAAVEVGFTIAMVSAVAIRGERLVLARTRASGRDPGVAQNDALNVVEIDADDRIATVVTYDIEDFDAAVAELDARYLAGESAPSAHTWSLVTGMLASIGKHEFPLLASDCTSVDHRKVAAFAPGELAEYIRAGWDLDQTIRPYVEVVHRLNHLGAVCTYAAQGASSEGFDAEWREVAVATVEGDKVNRCELFDASDIEVAIAHFERLNPTVPALENAARRVAERFGVQIAEQNWEAVAEILAKDFSIEDRRRVINGGIRQGRDAEIEDLQATAAVGLANGSTTALATRGARLILGRHRWVQDQRPDSFHSDFLSIVEIDADECIKAVVVFEPDDIDSAFAELDSRYLAGEAASYSHVWSIIVEGYSAVNRQELPLMTSDFLHIDHRRGPAFGPGEMIDYVRAGWDLDENIRVYVEAVHRLSDNGAVYTHAAQGVSRENSEVEWQMVALITVGAGRINRLELFDETDIDGAVAKFEELQSKPPQLENAASRMAEQFLRYFASRDWSGLADTLADDFGSDDRRRLVGAGVRHGRDAELADIRAIADVGITNVTSNPVATRGERLVLTRGRLTFRHQGVDAYVTESFSIVEINADERIVALVSFDLDDFDSALRELDARYLAGEAAPHSHTWSVLTEAYAALNRREHPATTPDWADVDHRRGISFAPGEVSAALANWNPPPGISNSIEAVHRLNDLGALVTSVTHETSREGFEAEWRGFALVTIDGDFINRLEIFDETDLDGATERFDQLTSPVRRLENAASQMSARLLSRFAAADWDGVAETLADDFFEEDRRRMVGVGARHGRDAGILNLRAIADLWVPSLKSSIVAIRGHRLILLRIGASGRDQGPGEVLIDVLSVVEINTEHRIAAAVHFDAHDIDAAIAELESRYLVGEAASYASVWSAIAGSYAALNRHELPLVTPDCVNVDHRRETAFGPGDVTAYVRAGWDRDQEMNVYVEQVHQLTDRGAVVTYAAHETSHEGLKAEWRGIAAFTVEAGLVNRTEVFDEASLETALARFEQLPRPTRRLESVAGQVAERFLARFAAHDWEALTELIADDFLTDDRRRVVGSGARRGRDAELASMRVVAELGGTNMASTIIATRGERLILTRLRYADWDETPGSFRTDVLDVIEIDSEERLLARIVFDLDDVDAAFAELEHRFITGEAAAHEHTWSVITKGYAALNRHEMFATTPDWVNIDHRQLAMIEEGGLDPSLHSLWSLIPTLKFRLETVHRLSDLGVVCTHVARGISQDGFDAEWRAIDLLTIDGDLITRCEVFAETDLDAAIARFDELSRPTQRLKNAASRIYEQLWAAIGTQDWATVSTILAEDIRQDDRRRMVGRVVRHGRDSEIENLRALADLGVDHTLTVIATRGERLALAHARLDAQAQAFDIEVLVVVEIEADNRIVAILLFDADNADAAFVELDHRYLKGEAAPYAHMWQYAIDTLAEVNRHEFGPIMQTFRYTDHRRVPFAPGDFGRAVEQLWDLVPDARYRTTTVHGLGAHGLVAGLVIEGRDTHGNELQWARTLLLSDDGPRMEVYEEGAVDAALASFQELHTKTARLENSATRVYEKLLVCHAARDWSTITEIVADDLFSDDRRPVVGAGLRRGRNALIADLRAVAAVEVTHATSDPIATRGARLALARARYSRDAGEAQAFRVEYLQLVEVDVNARITALVAFAPEDIDAAFEELERRYLAGEAADHARTWSVVADGYSALNRGEIIALPDMADVDHRSGTAIAPGDLLEYIRASLGDTTHSRIYVEAVHRLTDLGTVVSNVAKQTSREGFEAEWRMLIVMMVDGGLITRGEIFDETHLDGAVARFEELHSPAPRLKNAASKVAERFPVLMTAGDWSAMPDLLAADVFVDDRRRGVNAGIRHWRDAAVEQMRAAVDVGFENTTSSAIAVRGSRLALMLVQVSMQVREPDPFELDVLHVVENDADGRTAAVIVFDSDDTDAAFEELENRYLAGEAAAYARAWSVIADAFAGFHRRELPPMTRKSVYIDHRPVVSIDGVELAASMRALWDLIPDATAYIEMVHKLGERGAVITQALAGTSHEGFAAEARMICVFGVEGELFSRFEIFEEADLDAALARFDELDQAVPRLENDATRAWAAVIDAFDHRDEDALIALGTADGRFEDRRRGLRDVVDGSDRWRSVRAMFETLPSGWRLEVEPIAVRGNRLALTRGRYRDIDAPSRPIAVELLNITELSDTGLMHHTLNFDPDDMDGAFAELDARYLAGEAAPRARVWSVITVAYAALNHGELPRTTTDFVDADHRHTTAIEPGQLMAYLSAALNDSVGNRLYILSVHRLTNLGAVVTHAAKATSHDGFDAEWRITSFYTVDGDLINRCEMFDESDLDAALARFDELNLAAMQALPESKPAAGRAAPETGS